LEVAVVVGPIARHEFVQVLVLRVVQQRVVELGQPQIGVEVIADAEVEPQAIGEPPCIVDERVQRLGIELPVAGCLHRERDRPGGAAVDVERQIGAELEVAGLEEMRVVFVMGELEVAAELQIVRR
jgi:hypothetical protein